jgi:hypothetical protein
VSKEAEHRSRNTQSMKVALKGHGAESINGKRTDSPSHMCRKAVRQTEQRNATEQ